MDVHEGDKGGRGVKRDALHADVLLTIEGLMSRGVSCENASTSAAIGRLWKRFHRVVLLSRGGVQRAGCCAGRGGGEGEPSVRRWLRVRNRTVRFALLRRRLRPTGAIYLSFFIVLTIPDLSSITISPCHAIPARSHTMSHYPQVRPLARKSAHAPISRLTRPSTAITTTTACPTLPARPTSTILTPPRFSFVLPPRFFSVLACRPTFSFIFQNFTLERRKSNHITARLPFYLKLS
jgi:hypothetical protein